MTRSSCCYYYYYYYYYYYSSYALPIDLIRSFVIVVIMNSQDAASKLSGNSLTPKMGLVEIRKLLDDVIVFMRWQAEGSLLAVALEPIPDLVPTDILVDLKWLREDLMCVAANALKFSRERFLVPVIVRVTIDTDENNNDEQMLCFSFIDSGRNLSNDRLLTLFDHPMTLSNERLGMGGRGLGLYCLRERVTAMGGRCGAKTRSDGLEGTEVWFSIPLLHADINTKTFDIQQHYGSKIRASDTNASALNVPSSSKSKTSEFVTALGGSHRTSHDRPSLSTKPWSYDTSIRQSTKSSSREPINSSRSATSALVSTKASTKTPRQTPRQTPRLTTRQPSMDTSPVISSLKPSLDQVDEDITNEDITEEITSEDTGLGALPILIVDDSIAILKMVKRSILNELPDLVIKEARDGHEAFDRVQEETNGFHVIITDIQMPNCDGFDFTLRVREYESKNRLPPTMIVGMSANYQEKILAQSQACGMDGFLHKPFQLQTLLDVISHIQLHREITAQMDSMHQEVAPTRPSQVRLFDSILFDITRLI